MIRVKFRLVGQSLSSEEHRDPDWIRTLISIIRKMCVNPAVSHRGPD